MQVSPAIQPIFPKESMLKRYDINCPRYTSYPTAAELVNINDISYLHHLKSVREKPFEPLSLYLHIPFCHDICYYCGCNKVVTKKAGIAQIYLQYLFKEMNLVSSETGKRRIVNQLHLGGGTPTFLDNAQLTLLMVQLAQNFQLSNQDDREFSIEIDPRTITPDTLALLKGLGFNRLSFGVQDFDPTVQQAINRINSAESLALLVNESRALGFQSINLDLLYGLPLQTDISLSSTLEQVINIRPDRIALYNYAHMPNLFKSQKVLDKYPMPSSTDKMRLYKLAIQQLCEAGYHMIGMDHFVLPDDELYKAQIHKNLQRNFQGYSVRKSGDLLGLGVSAISQGDRFIHQNAKTLDNYYLHLDQDSLPIEKGLYINNDDLKRRFVIMPLMTQNRVDIRGWETAFGECFTEYFAYEIENLQTFINDNLVELTDNSLKILPQGQLFMRQIATTFDLYRKKDTRQFSKAL